MVICLRFLCCFVVLTALAIPAGELPAVVVSKDKTGFVLATTEKPFAVWGFNYDRDHNSRLIEDYWETDWERVERDFRAMKKLGANVVRIHLQFAKFMVSADTPNAKALQRLTMLLALAEETGLYLDVTGLGCYHKKDVPAWYDAFSETERWAAQAKFWEAIAAACAKSSAIFCYDLMNEPVVPAGKSKDGDWLGPAFAGKHYVQRISLDSKDRPRPDIGVAWVRQLVAAIRKHDKQHMITVGLVDWSLDRPGMFSGFTPQKIVGDLDFISVHLYPESGKVAEALKTLAAFSVGKPVVIEETFPMKCSLAEFADFIEGSKKHAAGVMGFYWGKPVDEMRKSKDFADAIVLAWLEFFEKNAPRN